MKNSSKVTLFKLLTAIGGVSVLTIPIYIIIDLFTSIKSELFGKIMIIGVATGCACGLLLMLLVFFGKFEMPKANTLKSQFKKGDYESFKKVLTEKLKSETFIEHLLPMPTNEICMTVFTRKCSMHCDVVVVTKVPEMDAEKRDDIENTFTSFLDSLYGGRTIRDTFEWIGFICVDKVTPMFKTMIVDSTLQDLKRSNIGIGISFGSNTYYMADVRDGFGMLRYKKLKKKTQRLLESIFSELA